MKPIVQKLFACSVPMIGADTLASEPIERIVPSALHAPHTFHLTASAQRAPDTTAHLAARWHRPTPTSRLVKRSSVELLQRFTEKNAVTLPLSDRDRCDLECRYGRSTVRRTMAYDAFASVDALRRQLAHENKPGISHAEFCRIDPYPATVTEPIAAAEPVDTAMHIADDASGAGLEMTARGRFGLPAGWHLDDKLVPGPAGLTKLRTRLTGPNGESGLIVRSFDGHTLHLDKAYKSTLPTRLEGLPGFDRPVSLINFLTARACRILGVTHDNLRAIKVNRLQHRPTLVHLEWLMRRHPGATIGALIGHTTWAKSYIRETADLLGQRVARAPGVVLEGSAAWRMAHPGAVRRDWNYLESETARLTLKNLTGQKVAKVDDPNLDWAQSAASALAYFKQQRCAGLARDAAAQVARDIDALLGKRLAAVAAEESGLRQRYGMARDEVPRHFNFDVIMPTAKKPLP